MTVAVLIQLISRPENHENMVTLLNRLVSITQTRFSGFGHIRSHVHYLKSNLGAFYILSKWVNEISMDSYLSNFNQLITPEITQNIVASPTISRARMLSQASNRELSRSQLTLVPFFYIIPRPEEIEYVKQAHLSVVDSTRAEPGCLGYDLYQSLDDPAIMFFYENWASSEALSQHMNTPNFYHVVRGQVDPNLVVPWTALEMTLIV